MAGMSRDKCGAADVAGFFKVVDTLKPKNVKVIVSTSVGYVRKRCYELDLPVLMYSNTHSLLRYPDSILGAGCSQNLVLVPGGWCHGRRAKQRRVQLLRLGRDHHLQSWSPYQGWQHRC